LGGWVIALLSQQVAKKQAATNGPRVLSRRRVGEAARSTETFPSFLQTHIIFGLHSFLRSQAFTLNDLW
jgi:hypothetical protein